MWPRIFGSTTEESLIATTPDQPVVTQDAGEFQKEVLKVASRAEKAQGIKEKIFTKEVKPDSVLVSRPYEAPDRLPSEPLVLPEWGIQVVEKRGPKLTVASLSRETGAAERRVFILSDDDTDYVLRAGSVAATLREARRFRFIQLEASLTGLAGIDLSGGSFTGGAILEGPVSFGGRRIRISPAVFGGFGGEVRVGVTATINLWGGH